MCGIYGLFSPDAPLPHDAHRWAASMDASLAHRGPDGNGLESLMGGRAILGHRRLAIIDVDGGTQPLANEDRSVWVSLNGEIYNYVELRDALTKKGHTFRTRSDTETLVHLYEGSGEGLLSELVGMFAFAMVDEKRGRLLLARDRAGEKPLYYARVGDVWAFASELKALRHIPGIDESLDAAGVAQFIELGYIPAPRTHLRGIRKLAAGQALLIDKNGARTWNYWRPTFPARPRRPIDALGDVKRLVRESVRIQLRSDVPVGAFLSGGVDSALVVSTAREVAPEADLRTFTVSFDDSPGMDEAPVARAVSAVLGTKHHEVRLPKTDLARDVIACLAHFDEPFADPSAIPTAAVCAAARKEAKVMLAGDGGDEGFLGYRQHHQHFAWRAARNPAVRSLARVARSSWRGRGAALVDFLARDVRQILRDEVTPTALPAKFALRHAEEARAGGAEVAAELERHVPLGYPRAIVASDMTRYLPDQILVKVDRMSMRAGLETRAPMLDHRLLTYACNLPPSANIENGFGKALLRKALPAGIPREVRWGPKRGFTPPAGAWLRDSLKPGMERALNDAPAALVDLLDPKPWQAAFERHLAGEEETETLWRWLALATTLEEQRS